MRFGYFINASNDLSELTEAKLVEDKSSPYDYYLLSMIKRESRIFDPIAEFALESNVWLSNIHGYIYTDDLDAEDDGKTRVASEKLASLIDYCQYLSLEFMVIELPLNEDSIVSLAQLLQSSIPKDSMIQVGIHIPMYSKIAKAAKWRSDVSEDEKSPDTWRYWHLFRSLLAPHKRYHLILELNDELLSDLEISRWLGEPIKAIVLPTSCFLTNDKGCPVLCKAHQAFIDRVMNMNQSIDYIIRGINRHQHITLYAKYLRHLTGKIRETMKEIAFEFNLSLPLQPLRDNLQSVAYENFERDPVKYVEYERSIALYLSRVPLERKIILAVVGAGRGPLVHCAIRAAKQTGHKLFIYVVEKNPNAIITLNSIDWQCRNVADVEIVAADMRKWQPEHKIDLVVSELLGSLSDNELSPECIDGINHCVKPDAVSIPCQYKSYVSPIMSQKMHVHTGTFNEEYVSRYPYEYLYVIFMDSYYAIDKAKTLFVYEHLKLDEIKKPKANDRYQVIEFEARIDCVCHGFAGYMDFTLIDDVLLSTHPEYHTPRLCSWFPMWIPLTSPINLKKDDILKLHFWRKSDATRVWYEWCVTEPVASMIHNLGGRSYSASLI